jgi:LmbE family N-acetylglucosaminyl deacetylase
VVAATTGPGYALLAVMAHADDAELWAGGVIARHTADGGRAVIALPQCEPERAAEAEAGAAILGASLRWLLALHTAGDLNTLLLDLRPEVVITHPLRDAHPDHRRIATALLDALPQPVIATGHPRRVYACDSYNSLTLDGPVHATTIVDTSATHAIKMRALTAHAATQPIEEHFGPMADNLARLWGARIGTAHGEAFTALPVLGRLPATAHL